MNPYTATEIAYKNGYIDGATDMLKVLNKNTDYLLEVIHYFSKEKLFRGQLRFSDGTDGSGRFLITPMSRKMPVVTLHCGDVILLEKGNEWKVGQCELCNGKWQLLGAGITQDNCDGIYIIYPESPLARPTERWLTEKTDFGVIPHTIVHNLLLKT